MLLESEHALSEGTKDLPLRLVCWHPILPFQLALSIRQVKEISPLVADGLPVEVPAAVAPTA